MVTYVLTNKDKNVMNITIFDIFCVLSQRYHIPIWYSSKKFDRGCLPWDWSQPERCKLDFFVFSYSFDDQEDIIFSNF